jgi:hypothetical protein
MLHVDSRGGLGEKLTTGVVAPDKLVDQHCVQLIPWSRMGCLQPLSISTETVASKILGQSRLQDLSQCVDWYCHSQEAFGIVRRCECVDIVQVDALGLG